MVENIIWSSKQILIQNSSIRGQEFKILNDNSNIVIENSNISFPMISAINSEWKVDNSNVTYCEFYLENTGDSHAINTTFGWLANLCEGSSIMNVTVNSEFIFTSVSFGNVSFIGDGNKGELPFQNVSFKEGSHHITGINSTVFSGNVFLVDSDFGVATVFFSAERNAIPFGRKKII